MQYRHKHNTLLLTLITTEGTMNYDKALRDLETKLARQKQAVEATTAMIDALRKLQDQDNRPKGAK